MSTKSFLSLRGLHARRGLVARRVSRRTRSGRRRELMQASALGVPIDPATRMSIRPRCRGDLGRRTLEPLGLTAEQLATARAVTYSAEHLEDASGALEVFYASVVKDRRSLGVLERGSARRRPLARAARCSSRSTTPKGARYLVDFVLDSAEQQFAVVSGDTRTTQAPALGHLALIVTGTGKDHKVRLLPLGDASFKSRRFTLFHVTVTPIL